MKIGQIQMDFIVAAGIFIAVFGLVVFMLTSYLSTLRIETQSLDLRADAFSLVSMTERNSSPIKLGLKTDIYRFYVVVDNSQSFRKNQTNPIGDLTDEIVNINFSDYGLNKDINSTIIYAENGSTVDYQITTPENISFSVNVQANSAKTYTVYFDDDSNFTSRSVSVSGTDNLTEKVMQIEKINAIQFRSLQALNATNYTTLKNRLGITNDFKLKLIDVSTVFEYGSNVPRSGDIVSLQRYVIYQNSTGGINNGRLTVQAFRGI